MTKPSSRMDYVTRRWTTPSFARDGLRVLLRPLPSRGLDQNTIDRFIDLWSNPLLSFRDARRGSRQIVEALGTVLQKLQDDCLEERQRVLDAATTLDCAAQATLNEAVATLLVREVSPPEVARSCKCRCFA